MFYALFVLSTPLLLVFGLYHLLTWFDLFRINSLVYWKKVGFSAAISHVLLATGFFLFTFNDYQAHPSALSGGLSYGAFLFDHTGFRQVLAIFDTLPLAAILLVFSIMDRAGVSGGLLPLAITITYILGTLQWYLLGGLIGALVGKFWEGLKTGEDGEEWFQ